MMVASYNHAPAGGERANPSAGAAKRMRGNMSELKIIASSDAPAAIGPYSQAVVVDGLLFTSGQIALDPATGEVAGKTVEEQAAQVVRNLGAVLAEAGCTFGDVVKTTCFLADMGDFAAFNEVYARAFVSRPARSCVAVRELPKGVLCEVELIAKVGE